MVIKYSIICNLIGLEVQDPNRTPRIFVIQNCIEKSSCSIASFFEVIGPIGLVEFLDVRWHHEFRSRSKLNPIELRTVKIAYDLAHEPKLSQ